MLTKKGRTASEVVDLMKEGTKLERIAIEGMAAPFTSSEPINVGNCTFPYPWQAPEPISTPLNYTYFTGGPVKVTKDEKKVVQMELLIKIAKETKMDINKLLALMEGILNG